MPNCHHDDGAMDPDLLTVVAVDAGGTSTRAGWFAADGRCLGLGTAAGANPISRGADAAMSQLIIAVRRAAGADDWSAIPRRPRLVLVALAGGSRSDVAVLRGALDTLGIADHLMLASDLLAGYVSGASEACGYGLIAGTGAAAIRVVDGAEVAVADGFGWLLGDRGSGFWIGAQAVQATMRSLDRGEPLPALARAVLAEQGLAPEGRTPTLRNGRHPAVHALVDAFYGAAPVDLARFASITVAVAASGNTEALDILTRAVSELVGTLAAVIDPALPGPIVLHGGVASALPALSGALQDLQRAQGWTADVRRSEHGLLGAAVLALRATGIEVTEQIRAELRSGITGRTTCDR